MPCEGNFSWSLSGIVAAFVDLAITYFLLCAAAVAFIASRFLGFFGLSLPCTCDGLFGHISNGNLCLHRVLIDFPAEKVSNVQLSVRANFPFNGVSNWRLIGERENVPQGYLEMGGDEGSCSSVSEARKSRNVARIELTPRNEFESVSSQGRIGVKGKGMMNQRHKGGIRRRRRRVGVDYGKSSSVSSFDPPYEEFPIGPPSPPSINKEDDDDPPTVIKLDQRDNFELNRSPEELEPIEMNFASTEELRHNGELGSSFHDKNRIRLLERALEHEQEARAALCLELEKERNAAATAADEAMAMILRLQEEKASIEMDARQYQRLIEEKSAYEEEEMNILKEILVRTERENLFLEKELDVYRQMTENEESSVDRQNVVDAFRNPGASSDLNEDPVLVLHQISASFDKIAVDGVGNSNDAKQNKGDSSDKKGDAAEHSYSSQEFQEKEMVFISSNSDVPPENGQIQEASLQPFETSILKAELPDHTVLLEGEVRKGNPNMETCDRAVINVCEKNRSLKYHETDGYQGLSCPCNLTQDMEPHVHDVHVVVDGSSFGNEVNNGEHKKGTLDVSEKIGHPAEASPARRFDVVLDRPSSSTLDAQMELKRSSSVTCGLPPVGPRGNHLSSDLRRSSMPLVENERLRIETEVGRLRERLKIVQEGREKLNLTAELREREKIQLKLLEDIARQLQEIRQLSEPEKAVRQASLPLPSSKGMSKKRRSRSVSVGMQQSS